MRATAIFVSAVLAAMLWIETHPGGCDMRPGGGQDCIEMPQRETLESEGAPGVGASGVGDEVYTIESEGVSDTPGGGSTPFETHNLGNGMPLDLGTGTPTIDLETLRGSDSEIR